MDQQEFVNSVVELKQDKPFAFEIVLKYFYIKLHADDEITDNEFVVSIKELDPDDLRRFLIEFWDVFHKQDSNSEG